MAEAESSPAFLCSKPCPPRNPSAPHRATPSRRRARPRVARWEWFVLAGLFLLALVPSLAGGFRVGEIVTGAPETAANARFLAMPVPVVLHIAAAIAFSFLAPFQFLPTLRRRNLRLHMAAGRYVLVPAGLVLGVTGLWMNAAYEMPAVDGLGLEISRYVVGVLMLVFVAAAVVAVARGNIRGHGAWMIRAYALAMGAGTQVLTGGLPMLFIDEPDQLQRLVMMDAGWLINMIVAELVIRRRVRNAARKAVRRDGIPA